MKVNIFEKRNDLIQKTCLILILSIVSLIIHLWHLPMLNSPIMMDDEVGYWGHAANLAGLSWTHAEGLWYSYGYSLVLMPLFWITHDITILYRLAIILNALFSLAIFWLGISVLRQLDIGNNGFIRIYLAFIASVYSAYIFQSNIAWSETLLYLGFMLTLRISIWFFKTPSPTSVLFLSMSSVGLYVIHNRSIVVWIALLMVLCYMSFKNRYNLKYLLIFLILSGICFFLNNEAKVFLSKEMWGVENGFQGNDLFSQKNNLLSLFTISGILELVQSLCGKIWYVLTSTLLTAFAGICFIVKKVFSKNENNVWSREFYFFLILSILGTLAVASISMYPTIINTDEPVRLDLYFYGRYTDMVCAVLIMLGLWAIIRSGNKYSKTKCSIIVIIAVSVYIVFGVSEYFIIGEKNEYWINTPCVPGIYFTKSIDYYRIMFIVIVLAVVLWLALMFYSALKNKYANFAMVLICSFVTGVFITVSENGFTEYIKPSQVNVKQFENAELLLKENSEYPVYFPEKGNNKSEYYYYAQHIRTYVVDGSILYEMPEEEAGDYFLILSRNTVLSMNLSEKYYIIQDVFLGEDLLIFVHGETLTRLLQKEGYDCQEIDNSLKEVSVSDIEIVYHGSVSRELNVGDNLTLEVNLKCKGEVGLVNNQRCHLSYHIYDSDGACILWDGERTDFGILLGESTVTLYVNGNYFKEPGEYVVEIDMVEEGVSWLSQQGWEPVRIHVLVNE